MYRLANLGLAGLMAPVLLLAALLHRVLLRRNLRPALLCGVTPIITIREIATAARANGLLATTAVRGLYPIHRREDFDLLLDELAPKWFAKVPRPVREILVDYRSFLWAVRRFTVFITFFDGRLLMRTPLRHLEFQLLRIAGIRTIVLGYGSDVQVADRIKSPAYRQRLTETYPDNVRRQHSIAREVDYTCKHANLVIGGVDWIDSLPFANVIHAAPFFVDTDRWRPADPGSTQKNTNHGQAIRVGHAPNHRAIKGTDMLVEAIDILLAEGVAIELVLLEGLPNVELPAIFASLDIFAEQFIVGWYGLTAVEAMSCGLPVLAYLREDLKSFYDARSFSAECPIVNTTTIDLADQLRALAADEPRRRELGRSGREYVERYHSAVALQTFVALLLREVEEAHPSISWVGDGDNSTHP